MLRQCTNYLTSVTFLLFTACASFGPHSLHISQQVLEKKLNEKLTQPFTVLKVFNVTVSAASLTMLPEAGQLRTLLHTHIQSPLMAQALNAQLTVTGVPKYSPEMQAVVLDQAEIATISMTGANAESNHVLAAVVKQASKMWLSPLVLYRVKPDELSLAGRAYVPTQMVVDADGIRVSLQPATKTLAP